MLGYLEKDFKRLIEFIKNCRKLLVRLEICEKHFVFAGQYSILVVYYLGFGTSQS